MKSLINSHLYFRYMNSQIEFIEFNLIIFCDGITEGRTLGLLESLDLSDRETKNLPYSRFIGGQLAQLLSGQQIQLRRKFR